MSMRLVKPPLVLDDDPGSLTASQGSSPWARAMRVELRHMWEDGTTQLQRFLRYLSLMEREQGYQQLDDAGGHPFPSMRAFCVTLPPQGAGIDPNLLDALAQETRDMTLGQKMAEVQNLHAKPGAPEGNKNASKNNPYHGKDCFTDKAIYGNSAHYHIARLKRDHPAIAEALARGDYPSVRAAAKAAGLVREPTAMEYVHRYWRKASPEARLQFLIDTLTPAERRALRTGLLAEED